jgi:hypothetical protein
MIEIVIMPRFGTGENASLLTADAPRAASSRQAAPHKLAASSLLARDPSIAVGGGWGERLSGSVITYSAPAQLWTRNPLGWTALADGNGHEELPKILQLSRMATPAFMIVLLSTAR